MQQQQNVLFACRMFGVQCGEKREENWISIGVTGKNSVKRIREHAATQYHVQHGGFQKLPAEQTN